MPVNPYDQVSYYTCARPQTHPDRLAAVATLFGMRPAPVANCRVLEIGCGDAGNLIPMAYSLPGSEFIGVDLAEGPIAAARRQCEELELRNLSLHSMDLREIGPDLGKFDFIIAHGLYSWIPSGIRDRLLAVCRDRLAPSGVAFVSYNVYPGRQTRHMLREFMLFHTRGVEDPTQKVEKARALLEFLQKLSAVKDSWKGALATEVEVMLKNRDETLYHDDLAPINEPVYLWQFAQHAARRGLQYVGDAELHQMFDDAGNVAGEDLSPLEYEQYLDFLRLRRFRQTILCGEEIQLNRETKSEQMEDFLFSAPARHADGKWKGAHGVEISSVDPDVPQIAQALADAYPLPVSFTELLPYSTSRDALRKMLFTLVIHGFVFLHVHDFPCQETVSEHPEASRVARLQARSSLQVANAAHVLVKLDEISRNLLLLLDGTRDIAQIARDLAALPDSPALDEVTRHLPASLQWMARMALLVG